MRDIQDFLRWMHSRGADVPYSVIYYWYFRYQDEKRLQQKEIEERNKPRVYDVDANFKMVRAN